MSYTIFNTDGTVLLLLADGQVDKSATSLTLIGKNYATYGQDLNNNFVKLLANSANTSGNPPRSPLKGQLWYDTTAQRLKVYDNGFKAIGVVNIASGQPVNLQTGDLWFDSTNHQLKLFNAGIVYTVGPSFSSTIGETGFVSPITTITDQESSAKGVILLKSYGTTLGLMYYDDTGENLPFDMAQDDQLLYAPNATTSTVVSGLTLYGDLSVSGKISNDYLSMNVDLDVISPNPNNDSLAFGGTFGTSAVSIQNPVIAEILDKMFPPNPTLLQSSTTQMRGLLSGSQARVLCKYTSSGGVAGSGYQVRVFYATGPLQNLSWQPYYYTTATVGGAAVPVNYIS